MMDLHRNKDLFHVLHLKFVLLYVLCQPFILLTFIMYQLYVVSNISRADLATAYFSLKSHCVRRNLLISYRSLWIFDSRA